MVGCPGSISKVTDVSYVFVRALYHHSFGSFFFSNRTVVGILNNHDEILSTTRTQHGKVGNLLDRIIGIAMDSAASIFVSSLTSQMFLSTGQEPIQNAGTMKGMIAIGIRGPCHLGIRFKGTQTNGTSIRYLSFICHCRRFLGGGGGGG